MPELPEVETIKLGLQQYLVGHIIESVEIKLPKMLQGEPKDIIGAKITGVERYGKGLVIVLDNGFCLAIHIKLTGQLIYQDTHNKPPQEVKIIKHSYGMLPHKWTHVMFHLDKSATLYYNDFRQFGWIKILPYKDLKKVVFFKELGPEFPFSEVSQVPRVSQEELTFKQFKELVHNSKTVIKPLLMDQTKISGLGNIYTNDGLYDAKIDPRRKANSLSDVEITRLFKSLEKVLKKGVESGGASELSYVNALGQEGGYQKHFLVYGQKGKPCKRCGTQIEKIALGGRGTFFCLKCQK